MAQITISFLILTIFTVISAVLGHKEPANLPFIISFTGALIVLSIWGAVREIVSSPRS
jgi:uncharacterized membrane protein YeaQ/YmgE (transglycosylase-associated protein family)